VFINGSAAVHFLFTAASLNLLRFLGLAPWTRLAVGLLAIGALLILRPEWLVFG
jgi:hypothetical protein